LDLSLPRGIRDIGPDEHRLHERIRDAFYEVARLYNFEMMAPAPIEHLSTLSAKSGQDIAGQIYSFKDKGGRDLGLRFDLTVGLTRYVSSRRDLKPPVKLDCFGGAWRYEEPQYGRYRWFHQWDIEIFGAGAVEADAEVMDASFRILEKTGLKNFVLQVGDRRVVEEFITKTLRVASQEKLVEMMRALDKVQRKTEAELYREYEAKGIKKEELKKLLEFGRLSGPPDKMIDRIEELHLSSVENLREVWDSLKSRGVRDVECSLSVVRGIDYYTALVFETLDKNHPELGSLCGGGRYDLLPRIFGRPDLPATGAAGGVERIAMSMEKGELTPSQLLYVAYAEKELLKEALHLVSEFRSEGVSVEASMQPKSLGKQLEDASDLGASWTVIVGKKELESGLLTLKDMHARKEERLSFEEIKRKARRSK
jgi:histidyl-tRNA synthetase